MSASPQNLTLKILEDLSSVEPSEWGALTGGNPTLRHAFLQSLIEAGCTNEATGWHPQFLTLWRSAATDSVPKLVGAVPLYQKTHSYGEFVFDWAWAEAYERHGLAYYPKLIAASPFTPCPGARLLAKDDATRQALLSALLDWAKQQNISSLHVLFPQSEDLHLLTEAGLQLRSAVQFHWTNHAYRDFDAFLSTFSHDKRKKIRQERKRVANAGIRFQHLVGAEILESHWDFFYACYAQTYAMHRSIPYLNREFFALISQRMPENLVMIVASRNGAPIACALNFLSAHTLYGRYWGTMEFHSGLHFETAYYQGLEFCIAHGIQTFEGGAQGEHKLARGFLPVKCQSAHWLRHPQFARAVEDYLARESGGVDRYLDELNDSSPYRK